MLTHRHIHDVLLCLLERRQDASVALADTITKVHLDALLLDEHLRLSDIGIHERSGAQVLHLALKLDERKWVVHAIDLLQQFHPELLGLPFLIALVLPLLSEGLGGDGYVVLLCHINIEKVNSIIIPLHDSWPAFEPIQDAFL